MWSSMKCVARTSAHHPWDIPGVQSCQTEMCHPDVATVDHVELFGEEDNCPVLTAVETALRHWMEFDSDGHSSEEDLNERLNVMCSSLCFHDATSKCENVVQCALYWHSYSSTGLHAYVCTYGM